MIHFIIFQTLCKLVWATMLSKTDSLRGPK